MSTRFLRFVFGGVLAAGLAAIYATGFFYTSQAAVITAGVVGFVALLIPYPLRVSGRLSVRLVLVSLVTATVLFAGMILNAATRVEGNVLAESWRMISEAGWTQYGLPAWGLLLGGVCFVGMVLPAQNPA